MPVSIDPTLQNCLKLKILCSQRKPEKMKNYHFCKIPNFSKIIWLEAAG